MFVLIALMISFAHSQEVPFIANDPPASKVLDQKMFDFISQTLGAGKLAAHMKCSLKTRASREIRKFSDGEKWVEILDVEFCTNGFESGQKMTVKIPMIAKYGTRQDSNLWSGVGEVVKIEMNDYYDHWLKFTHDGRGQIVELSMGNRLRNLPCEIKR